jgi:hypothetical protein
LLKDFFISKVTENKSIAHNFYWRIKLEKDNNENKEEIRYWFSDLFDAFQAKLEVDHPETKDLLLRQWEFRNKLYELSSYIKETNNFNAKITKLQEAVGEGGKYEMLNFDPTPIPLDPSVFV